MSPRTLSILNNDLSIKIHETVHGEKYFWPANKTLEFLRGAKYFCGNDGKADLVWPKVIKAMIDPS